MRARSRLAVVVVVLAAAGARPAAADVAVSVGGGTEDFSRRTVRDETALTGVWEVRLQLGTQRPVSLEAAYAAGSSTTLESTTVESALRANLRPGTWQPFALLGVGWRRYAASSVMQTEKDNLVEVPLGLGLQVSHGAWRADTRFTYRVTESYGLAGTTPLDTWSVTAHLGLAL